jgi:tetratricopeptide (TPR) repeat protein
LAKLSYTREEVRRLLGLSERQWRSWEKQGLVQPRDGYGFSDLVALRTLIRLRSARVPPRRIRQVLAALRKKLRDVANPLVEVRIFSEGRKVRVRLGGRTMEPESGQLLLDFGEDELRALVALPRPGEARSARAAADRLFQLAIALEQEGAIKEAIDTYREALEADPGLAGASVNLGTLYFTMREFREAERYYRLAVEADPDYPLAYFNLANLCEELGRKDEALSYYESALRLNPRYSDAHYNLALLHQSSGRPLQAVGHWKAYLKLDPASSWAAIARRELERLYRETVVESNRKTP